MKLTLLLAVIRAALLVLGIAAAFDSVLLVVVGPRPYAVFPLALLAGCWGALRMTSAAIRRAAITTRPREPAGVRIEHADGSATPVELILDPEVYPDGITRWIAMPPEGTVFDPLGGDQLAGIVPPRTSIAFSLRARMLPGADDC